MVILFVPIIIVCAQSAGLPTIPESLIVKNDEGFGTDALFSCCCCLETYHGIVIIAVAVYEWCLESAVDGSVLAGQELGQVCLIGYQNQVVAFEYGIKNLKQSVNLAQLIQVIRSEYDLALVSISASQMSGNLIALPAIWAWIFLVDAMKACLNLDSQDSSEIKSD